MYSTPTSSRGSVKTTVNKASFNQTSTEPKNSTHANINPTNFISPNVTPEAKPSTQYAQPNATSNDANNLKTENSLQHLSQNLVKNSTQNAQMNSSHNSSNISLQNSLQTNNTPTYKPSPMVPNQHHSPPERPPGFLIRPQGQYLQVGSRLVLRCQIHSTIDLQTQWLKNNSFINEQTVTGYKIHNIDNEYYLEVDNVDISRFYEIIQTKLWF